MEGRLWHFLTEVNPRTVVDVFSALLTPMIGIATVYIAYQQWRTNKTRLNLERYDRRLAIYKVVDAFYGEIATYATIKFPMMSELRFGTAEAAFLFAGEIERHLAELYQKGIRVAVLREQLYPSSKEPGLPVGEARSKAVTEEGELVLWFQEKARAESKRLFGKYLRLA